MFLSAEWIISGIVTERRELTSQKNASWRGYAVKVASLGATFDLQVTPEQFATIAQGEMLKFRGTFQEQGGFQKFIVGAFEPLTMPTAADVAKPSTGRGAA